MKSLTDKQMDELERKGHVVILFPLVKTVVVDGCKYYRYVPASHEIGEHT